MSGFSRTAAVSAALVLAPGGTGRTEAQGAIKTVWDGVYSAEQAGRGKLAYETSCSSCHQPTLSGGGEAPALVGEPFMERWREDSLNSLFTRIKTLMPFDDPATLSNQAYLEIVTYLLQANAFPAGTKALEPDDLEYIRIVGKEGPAPVPNFALVQVLGCVTQGPNQTWLLTNSTDAVRTSSPKGSGEPELKAAEVKPLGTHTYRLLGVYPSPDSHAGHKVEVKGFLVRMADETRINVSSLQMIASSCGK